MKLVSVEHLFGGDRIVFYFVAESRVDFRGLVRDLAREFQTRIEMRQIGVRDEARLLGDYERCGRPLCCRTWIKDLAPVSMKMAKVQKATLDPSKISGHCGRLMCCLRFEHSTYKELARNLPRKNTYVRVREGVGKVVDSDVVTQIVGVFLPGGTRINVPVESILERDLSSEQVEQETSRRGERRPRRRSGRKSRGEGKSSGGSGGGKDRSGQKRRRRSRRRGRRKDRSSGSSRGNAAGSDRKTDSAASNRNPSNGPRGNG